MKFTICTRRLHFLSGKVGEYCVFLQRKNKENSSTLNPKGINKLKKDKNMKRT